MSDRVERCGDCRFMDRFKSTSVYLLGDQPIESVGTRCAYEPEFNRERCERDTACHHFQPSATGMTPEDRAGEDIDGCGHTESG